MKDNRHLTGATLCLIVVPKLNKTTNTTETKMSNFNIWSEGQHSVTTVIANDMNQALDIYCNHNGFIDHADYCQERAIEESDLNIVAA